MRDVEKKRGREAEEEEEEKEDVETSRNKYVCAQKSLSHRTHTIHQGEEGSQPRQFSDVSVDEELLDIS